MKKKWYHTNTGTVVVLFLFFPLGLYFVWKYGSWKLSTKWKITGALFLVLFLWSLIFNLSPRGQQTRIEQEKMRAGYNSVSSQPTNTSVPVYTYEVVEKKDNGNVENYKVLINPGDDGKAIAAEVKKQCNKSCNIDIYDDKTALKLQKEYDNMMGNLNTDQKELQTWKQNNYIFVADHLIGYMSFDTSEYQEYPYKDWYYQELKGN